MPIDPQLDLVALQRRTLRVVIASQILGGAGLAAGVTVGALLARDMLGSEALGGLPAALFTLGSAGSAWLVGRISAARGRRIGLSTGFFTGAVGAALVVVAAAADSLPLLFVAFVVYGAGTSTNLQARYAGTDLAAPERRAKAVSMAMVSTTVGAVAGPNLVGVTGSVATGWGLPALTGPFMLAGVAFVGAGAVLWLLLRPDPLLVALQVAPPTTEPSAEAGRRSINPGVIMGATVMVVTQISMVAIMTMTPIHMEHHGHGVSAIGLVISVHIGAMFLPSLITGSLVDRFGRIPMALVGGGILLAAGLLAAFGPADSMVSILLALALLGLGWNIGLISGTALIVDATDHTSRAKTQGSVDLLIALAGSGGAAASGAVVAMAGFSTLGLIGGLLSIILIPVVAWTRRQG